MEMRVRFSIWNDKKGYWVTSWCLVALLQVNIDLMTKYGLKIRVG